MKEKIKLTDATEKFLTSPKGYKKSWVRSFLGIILASIIIGIVMGISYNYGPFSSYAADSKNYWELGYKLAQHKDLMVSATYLCYAVIGCFCTPFICGLATWLIGINQVTKSKYFHLFMWFMIFLSILLAMIALTLLARSCVYPPQGIPPAENSDGSQPTDGQAGAVTQALSQILML